MQSEAQGPTPPARPMLRSPLSGTEPEILGGADCPDLPRGLPELARWVLPVVAVLLGFLAQNAGLYFGTRSYVLWMDEAHRPLQGLDDRHQEGSFTAASKSSWLPTLAWGLEIVTDLLPVLWFGVVMRSSNLRLWSQTLLTAALLSTLK
ncbi:unnamed protein product, partial [Polarella glacialis]